MIVFRLLYIILLFVLICFFIRSCIGIRKNGSILKAAIFIVLLCVLCYFGTGDHMRNANVNEESLECVTEHLTIMGSGDYEFEIENISGTITIMDNVSFENDIKEFFGNSDKAKVGTTENGVIYSLSPVVACHHDQLLYMCYPTAANGDIYLFVNGKYIYIGYYYTEGNLLDFLWGVIAPDYFWCREVNVDEIFRGAIRQSGDG